MDWISENQIFIDLPVNWLLAITAYGEAANQGTEGMMAVLNVIRNRTQEPGKFADSGILKATGSIYHAVILKPYQFSMYNLGDQVRSTAEGMAIDFTSATLKYAELRKALDLANMLRTGVLEDNTQGATYYHADYMASYPQWSQAIPFIGKIGNHLFYGYKESPILWSSSILLTVLAISVFFQWLKKRGN